MKLTAVLLLLVAVGVALAGPQRTSRRFTPRRGQDAETVAADEVAPEADLAEGEEPAPPRFRIASKPSGSSFAPKRSASTAPVASSDDVPAERAVAEPAPTSRAPVQASPSRPRTRGSRTFVESIGESNIPLEASQLEALDKSKQSLQRISSRPSSRPSSRVPTSQSATPALRTPSRPSSLRVPLEHPNTPTNAAESETVASSASPLAGASKSSGGDQESRRQRLLALKKRPRAGAPSAISSADESEPEEKPAETSSVPVEATKEETIEKTADTMQDRTSVPKLDEEVTKTLDETIKAEAQKEDVVLKKEMAAKEVVAEKAEEKMPDKAEPSPDAVTPEPEASTTTTAAAPAARPRRINTITKLRASRPVGGSSIGGARPRTPAAAAGRGESPTNEVQPRLSSRSGGRGNSRGGAALTTSTRVSRPSSRVVPSRTGVTEGEEANAALLDAPAAGTTGSSVSFRSKLPPTSRRRNQVPLSIRHSAGDQKEDDESRVAEKEGRRLRTVRHSLPDSEHSLIRPTREGRSTAPVRKQVGANEKKTQRAGVRSLIERLRGRKTNRMRIDEEQEAIEEVAEENVKIDEQLIAINQLAESPPKSELDEIDNTSFAVSITTSKPTTVVVVTTQTVTTMVKSTAIASTTERVTAASALLSPRNLLPGVVKQRENSKRPDKRRPRGRIERRRRPINFSAVELVSPLPISSTSAEATTVPPQSTTAETTTLPPPSSTNGQTITLQTPSSIAAQTTTLPPPLSTTAKTTTLRSPLSTTAETTTLRSTLSTTAETTTLPPPSSTSSETPTLPPPSTTAGTTLPPPSSTTPETTTVPPPSTTAGTTTLQPPSSTTAETTTLPSPSTTAETTTLPPPSSTTAETTTLQPPSSTTAETTTLPSPSTTAETTTLPPPSSTTAQTTTVPVQSSTTQTTPRPRRLLPAIGRTTRLQQSTTQAPLTTLAATTKPSSPRTTTLSPAITPESARSAPLWKPRVAPEDPVDATFNRGGFRFQPHPSSESDITRRRGEVVLTQVGILEDTPPNQVAVILRGLGSRRRGLARPPSSRLPTSTQPTIKEKFSETDYYYDDY